MPLCEFPRIRTQLGPILARLMADPDLTGMAIDVEPARDDSGRNDLVVSLTLIPRGTYRVVIPWQLETWDPATIRTRCQIDLDHALGLLKSTQPDIRSNGQ